MSNFAFETITAAQALAITGSDTLSIAQSTGTATGVTVIYTGDAAGDISVTFGGQTELFGPGIADLSHTPGSLTFADGSQLYIGDAAANLYNELVFNPLASGSPAAAFGGDGADNLAVNGARDLLQGNAGDDVLTGNNGDDTIYGGQGNDVISVGSGTNFGQGNKGDDTITGAGSDDTLLGGQGDDKITGAGVLDGNLGNDSVSGSGQLLGEAGDDSLASTGTANSLLVGSDGNDTIASNSTGNDTLSGGNGDDSIVAGTGADSITGDAGADTITVNGHAERIAGGAGADVFIFNTGTTAVGTVPGITDWTGSEDKIRFAGFTPNPSDYAAITDGDYATAVSDATRLITQNHFTFVAVQIGSDVVIFAGGSGGITSAVDLIGRSLSDFDPHNNLI
ncbi:calcium-binding protein [Phenylobacterium sp.]|jgi:Ca2+-binding RTX toxin-like protein|uniref:calcium-binding protein n=1 Tax=Phenylobacterium sp. TaxID=1871053 RepID=UPI002F40B2C5